MKEQNTLKTTTVTFFEGEKDLKRGWFNFSALQKTESAILDFCYELKHYGNQVSFENPSLGRSQSSNTGEMLCLTSFTGVTNEMILMNALLHSGQLVQGDDIVHVGSLETLETFIVPSGFQMTS